MKLLPVVPQCESKHAHHIIITSIPPLTLKCLHQCFLSKPHAHTERFAQQESTRLTYLCTVCILYTIFHLQCTMCMCRKHALCTCGGLLCWLGACVCGKPEEGDRASLDEFRLSMPFPSADLGDPPAGDALFFRPTNRRRVVLQKENDHTSPSI